MKFSIKSIAALLLVLALCLGLAACGGKTDNKDTGAETNPPADSDPSGSEPAGSEPADSEPAGPDATEPEPAGSEGVSLIDMSIPEGTELGSRIKDFSFTTYDGKEYNLYDTLKTKKMVLINCWATWCGPCQAEFPHMTTAYEEYKDDIEIFAISCEAEDTDEVLADYVASMGMTFPVGRDVTNVYGDFSTGYIPITIIVDRFGVVCLVAVGSQSSPDTFRRAFDIFTADDYTESVLLDSFPGPKPTVDPVDPETLSAALNAEGSSIVFENPSDGMDWPMKVMNKSDRSYALSTNKNVGNTNCVVSFSVTAEAGQVLALDYMCSTEKDYDYAIITVNDEVVKVASGEVDWTTWAYAFAEAGTYRVELIYMKDEATDEGSDLACFDEVRLLSAEDGAALLATLPQYPHADTTSIVPADSAARQVLILDPTGLMEANFSGAVCYIVPGAKPAFNVTLAEGLDAEGASVLYFCDGSQGTDSLADKVNGDVYTVSVPASAQSTYSYITVNPSPFDEGPMVLYFSSEEALNTFLARNLQNEDGTLAASWKYADGSAPSTTEILEGNDAIPDGSSLYTLVFVDQNGDPVPGVTANVCDDSSCTPMVSDAQGVIGFVKPDFAYHIQVIKVPDGYTYDTSIESYLSETGGVTEITVTKN